MMYEKLQEEIIYKGYRTLVKKLFKLPSGKIHEYDIVKGGAVVCALVLDKNNRIVITQQFRPGPEKTLYVLPGGMMDAGETPLEAVAREVFEETGYKGEVMPLASTWAGAYSTTLRHHFLITNAEKSLAANIDYDEVQSVALLDKNEIMDKVWAGEMMDVETLFLGFERLKKRSF